MFEVTDDNLAVLGFEYFTKITQGIDSRITIDICSFHVVIHDSSLTP
ncbi:unnamed protein product, partial [Arabidopsis halleri]